MSATDVMVLVVMGITGVLFLLAFGAGGADDE